MRSDERRAGSPRREGREKARIRNRTHNSDHSSRRIFFLSSSLVTAG